MQICKLFIFQDIDEAEAGSCDCDDVCINKLLDRDGVKFECECSDVNTVVSSDGRTCRGLCMIVRVQYTKSSQ